MAKDAKGHGSEKSGVGAMPIPGHPYHMKSNAELHYIAKDAHEAAQAMQSHGNDGFAASENKYLDQVNDASTVLGYRARGGSIVQPPPAAHQGGVESATHPPDGTRIMRDGVANSTRTRIASDPVHRTSPIDGQYFK